MLFSVAAPNGYLNGRDKTGLGIDAFALSDLSYYFGFNSRRIIFRARYFG